MASSKRDIVKLRRIITLAEMLIESGGDSDRNGGTAKGPRNRTKRIRRTGAELLQFRKMLKTERKKGIPVAELAEKHGISSAYIYMIR